MIPVILHMDLDCFYAQVERNRLNLPESVPLVVQQWSSLIAVNYEARKAGITRHMTINEAKDCFLKSSLSKENVLVSAHCAILYEKDKTGNDANETDCCKGKGFQICYPPAKVYGNNVAKVREMELLLQSNPTTSETTTFPKSKEEEEDYDDDGSFVYPPLDVTLDKADRSYHKISLYSFRKASRAIFKAIQKRIGEIVSVAFADVVSDVHVEPNTSSSLVVFEKASIDEFYLDLSELINHNMTAEQEASFDSPVNWTSDLGILEESKEDPSNFDELSMNADCNYKSWLWDKSLLEGAKIAKDLTNYLFEKLGYRVSGGIAHDKMLAKLATGRHKPNQRTIIRERDRVSVLAPLKISDIPNFGGKLGALLEAKYPTVADAWNSLPTPASVIKACIIKNNNLSDNDNDNTIKELDSQTAEYIYKHLRGQSAEPVESKCAAKSLMSAKSFVPNALQDRKAVTPWLFILAIDLIMRLQEMQEEIRDEKQSKEKTIGNGPGILAIYRFPKTLTITWRPPNTKYGQHRAKSFPSPITITEFRRTENGSVDVEGLSTRISENPLIHAAIQYPVSHMSLSFSNFEEYLDGNTSKNQYKSITKLWAKRARDQEKSTQLISPSSSSSSLHLDESQKRVKKTINTLDSFFHKIVGNNDVIVIDKDHEEVITID